MADKKGITKDKADELLRLLEKRFEKHAERHPEITWASVQARLEKRPETLQTLHVMEETGGEPDVIGFDKKSGKYIFCDCSPESPKGRRSVCYDPEALESRKEHKPKHSAVGMAHEMGVELLTKEQYNALQELGEFDTKTSSWVVTPDDIRERGGALFGDRRFGHVFIYHNGAESYYAARGFRGRVKV